MSIQTIRDSELVETARQGDQCAFSERVMRRRVEFLHLDQNFLATGTTAVQLPAGGPDPECEVASRQSASVVRREVGRIPPLLRDVIILRDLNRRLRYEEEPPGLSASETR